MLVASIAVSNTALLRRIGVESHGMTDTARHSAISSVQRDQPCHILVLMDRYRFNEGSSGTISGTILDPQTSPEAVPLASLTSATLTLFDLNTVDLGSPISGIINDRHQQDVLNANDVEITDGAFIWSVQSADTVILTERRQVERHRALFTFTWGISSSPSVSPQEYRTSTYECEIEVANLVAA